MLQVRECPGDIARRLLLVGNEAHRRKRPPIWLGNLDSDRRLNRSIHSLIQLNTYTPPYCAYLLTDIYDWYHHTSTKHTLSTEPKPAATPPSSLSLPFVLSKYPASQFSSTSDPE